MTWLERKSARPGNLIVNTSRLDQILEHEPADLIAITQAGVKLTDFNSKLAENGQWLPLDPPDDGRATIGGVVATGLGGAQQFGYGRPRGSVIGMKVVLANGDMIKAGGRVVKNVAGYDLCKLFTGSYGTLGIITEVNFKLRPRPVREATVVTTGTIRELLNAARAILEARLFPVAAEIVSSDFANRLGLDTRNAAALLIRFAGNEKGVAYQIDKAVAQLRDPEVMLNDAQLWRALAGAALEVDDSLSWSIRVLPSELLKISDAIADSFWQIGALDGRMRLKHETSFGEDPKTPEALMKRLKQQLDPLNILPRIDAD